MARAALVTGAAGGIGAVLGYRDEFFLRTGYHFQPGGGSGPALGVGAVRGDLSIDLGMRFEPGEQVRDIRPSLGGRIAAGFDSQLFDILTFKIYQLKSMRYQRPIWDIIKEKAPASLAIQATARATASGSTVLPAGVPAAIWSRTPYSPDEPPPSSVSSG